MTDEDRDRALLLDMVTERARSDFGTGSWKKCATGSASPVPGICPDGAWTYPGTHNPEVHDHWVPNERTGPEVYWWMECIFVVVRHNADGKTVRAFVLQPSTGKYWWKTQPYPLPADARRVPVPPALDAESYRRGYANAEDHYWNKKKRLMEEK